MSFSPYTFTAMLSPPLGLPLAIHEISAEQNRRHYHQSIAICIALFMASFAYSYIPTGQPDIVRYFEFIERISGLNYFDALTVDIYAGEHLYFFNTLCWVAGRLGDYHILPAFSVFVCYYIGVSVTLTVANDCKADGISVAKAVALIVLAPNFYSMINNVRNVLAFCIGSYAVFRDCYMKKRNLYTLILYILPVFLHPTGILILLLRFIIILPGWWKIPAAVLSAFSIYVIDTLYFLSLKLSAGGTAVEKIKYVFKKGYVFFHDTTSDWAVIVARSGSYAAQRYLYISFAAVFCIAAYVTVNKIKKEDGYSMFEERRTGLDRIADLAFCLGLMTIMCFPMQMPEFWRFASAMLFISGPTVVFFQSRKPGILGFFFDCVCLLYIPILAAIWVRDLRNSDILEFLTKPFYSSPFIVALKSIAFNLFS